MYWKEINNLKVTHFTSLYFEPESMIISQTTENVTWWKSLCLGRNLTYLNLLWLSFKKHSQTTVTISIHNIVKVKTILTFVFTHRNWFIILGEFCSLLILCILPLIFLQIKIKHINYLGPAALDQESWLVDKKNILVLKKIKSAQTSFLQKCILAFICKTNTQYVIILFPTLHFLTLDCNFFIQSCEGRQQG